MTFEAWVKFRQVSRTTNGYDWQCLFAKSAHNASYALMLCTEPAYKVLRFYHPGATPSQSDLAWHLRQCRQIENVLAAQDDSCSD